MLSRGFVNGEEIGKIMVLPASYTGGRRYMVQNYHDGLAICRVHGPPDFFLTFTCNPQWPDITNSFFERGQSPPDRSDVVVRVYHMKFDDLIQDIKGGALFGPCHVGTSTTIKPHYKLLTPKCFLLQSFTNKIFRLQFYTLLNSKNVAFHMVMLYFGYPQTHQNQLLS